MPVERPIPPIVIALRKALDEAGVGSGDERAQAQLVLGDVEGQAYLDTSPPSRRQPLRLIWPPLGWVHFEGVACVPSGARHGIQVVKHEGRRADC